MQTVKTLQDMLTRAAREFELDLTDVSVVYRLEDKLGNTITIQIVNDEFLRIGEYKDFGDGKLTGDPEFLIFTSDKEWLPVGFSAWGSNHVSAMAPPPDDRMRCFIPEIQAAIAEKCEAWVSELMERNGAEGETDFLIPAWLT